MLQITDAWNGRANEEEQIELHQGEGAAIKRVTACSRSLMPGMVERMKRSKLNCIKVRVLPSSA
jgi:hypothetical protein